uniref:Uncharacterized protein n=1 Tax=Alexandrium catenella TaxID=2925 RepID=A0A7S1RAA9_ALECA
MLPVLAPPPPPSPQAVQPAVAGVPAPRGQALRTGMKVCLRGFSSEAMNGLKGTLGRFSEKQGSWQVFLESSSAAKAVRPQNLELLPDQDDAMKDAALPGAAAGGAPAGDDPMAEVLPPDNDGDAWVELLRDAYMRQLRSDNEYPEPPPYERVNRLAANQFPVPEGMFPAHALRMQSQMLHRCFNGDGPRPGRRRPGMPPPPRFVAGFVFPQNRMY